MFLARKEPRTLIWADLIGVKNASKRPDIVSIMDGYWKSIETWAFYCHQSIGSGMLRGKRCTQVMDVNVTVFSDSALIELDADYEIQDIYKVLTDFQRAMKNGGHDVYTILNRDEDIVAAKFPAVGATRGNFHAAVGSGRAWIDLYSAALFVENKQDWRQYRSYVVSEKNLGPNIKAKGTANFSSIDGISGTVLAIA